MDEFNHMEWKASKLSDLIESTMTGEWGTEQCYDENDIEVLRSTNFTNSGKIDYSNIAIRNINEKKRNLKSLIRGDTILEKSGGSPSQPVGRVIYFDKSTPFLYSNFTQRIIPSEASDPKFLFYLLFYLYTSRVVLKFQQQTTGIINFQLSEYLEYVVQEPPLPEQKKIAKILTAVDTVIEKTQAQIDKLNDLKTGMMQELLTKGIGPDGKPHTEFKESAVGLIPVGWDVVRLGEVTKSIVPGRNKPALSTGEIPWITISDLDSLYIDSSKEKLGVNLISLKAAGGKTVPKGTVIMTVVGDFGISSIAATEVVINQQLHGFVCNSRLDPEFLCYFLRNSRSTLDTLATKTTISYMNKDNAESVEMPLPSLKEQKNISKVLVSLERKLQQMVELRSNQIDLKTALMQDLLTGKVRVTSDE